MNIVKKMMSNFKKKIEKIEEEACINIPTSHMAALPSPYSPHDMTKEDHVRLQELQGLLAKWKLHKRLICFKQLSAKIREEIIEEKQAYNIINKANNVDTSDFKELAELNHLQMKNSYMGYHMNINCNTENYPLKYSIFVLNFTYDQLLEAHASVAIEEELLT